MAPATHNPEKEGAEDEPFGVMLVEKPPPESGFPEWITEGCMVEKVNGQDCTHWSYTQFMSYVKGSGRPLTMMFHLHAHDLEWHFYHDDGPPPYRHIQMEKHAKSEAKAERKGAKGKEKAAKAEKAAHNAAALLELPARERPAALAKLELRDRALAFLALSDAAGAETLAAMLPEEAAELLGLEGGMKPLQRTAALALLPAAKREEVSSKLAPLLHGLDSLLPYMDV